MKTGAVSRKMLDKILGPGLKMKTIDQAVEDSGGSIRAAAMALGVDYGQFYRWHKRAVFAPENSSTRRELRSKGIELPRRPSGRRQR